ncbi:MAG: four helix bundle protein [Salinibacter sp.]
MGAAQSFRDLETYQKARQQSQYIFRLTQEFPKEETYSLTDQIRRSSRAVCALLAEAWARRPYEAAFVNKLNQALAEAMETQSWLDAAHDCGYIEAETHDTLDTEWERIGGAEPHDPARRELLRVILTSHQPPNVPSYYRTNPPITT